ncbi:MAG: ribonuclease Z [Clostridia bacterium]|nr:ribonuclease Z [Clostridia bacterium]
MLDVALLGTGGTMPLKNRRLASVMLRHNGSCTLIDCGEGTQLSVKECGFTFKPIDRILITHFHADHMSGIPGLLLSMGNEGRTDPLTMIGPVGLERVVNSLRVIAPELPFEINFIEQSGKICELSWDDCTLTSFSLRHAVPCRGYRLDIRRVGKFDVEKARANNVPMRAWSPLQKQDEFVLDGVRYTSDMVLGQERKGLRFVYATDTRPAPVISEMAEGADLFICEGMFGESEKLGRAKESGHMTFSEAAKLASLAKPKLFWLTHYSPSMPAPMAFADEAKSVFSRTRLGADGDAVTLRFEEDE